MSVLLHLEKINFAIGEKVILEDITETIEDGQKIGVIGINGAGKSTLLSVIAGTLEADSGEITSRKNAKISYLPQNPVFDNTKSVLENVAAEISGKETHWDVTGEAKAMLLKFGITNPDMSPELLSGGQRKRAALIAALLTPCDLLILDEPTNHLDTEMIEYLEERLNEFKGALLMVTHDRYFLDEVTDRIWELDRASLFSYEGNYSTYLTKKQERLDFAKAAERKMAALYKQDLKWIMRGARARSTKQKAHIKRFEALRDREKIIEERQVAISSMASRLGKKIIEIDGISKAYDGRVLFHDFSHIFTKNERVGIIGKNGCGKTTLIKIITGNEMPDSGTIDIGTTVKIGYFSQENEELDDKNRVIDEVREVAENIRTDDGIITASNMCERFLFDKNMQYTLISKLSGGEKRRLYLLKVLMSAPNVLILDEPTNDLDIATLQVLEDYLDTFNGVIITVSHDRYFLDRVVSRIFAFREEGTLMQSEGAYTEYEVHLEEMGEESSQEGQEAARKKEEVTDSQKTWKSATRTAKLSYKEQREYDTIEAEIDALTEKSEELAAEMLKCGSSYMKLEELTKEKDAVDAELDRKMERFFELQEKVDSFAKQ
ncbi:MAG: ABC-F family ATP-binding cassette domain-containing protein [Eubacteriales bacterium]|nr:ABC-F family ATP-binding cassette domain-containing protein [Eubacteriales bacterium]